MINFKKSTGKVGKLKRDLRINLDTIINKNLEIDDTDLDGEKVMMNLEKGEYFMMNEVGSRIWEIISKPINVKDIIENIYRGEYIKYLDGMNPKYFKQCLNIAKNIRFFKITRPVNKFTVDDQIELIERAIIGVKEAAV